MSDQTITSLIEKLEGAEPNDAWVFAPDVHIALFGGSLAKAGRCPKYTTSLDAALALAERVLAIGAWDVGYYYNSDRPHYARLVIVRDDEGQPEIYGRSATPALALCAAILRAQSEARV